MKSALVTIYAALACGCAQSWDEVVRVSSPNGKLDGVVLETSGGAATSYSYQVHIVESGKKAKGDSPAAASLYGAIRNDSAYGVNLRWESDATLFVEYFKAQRVSQVIGPTTVKVALRDGIVDPSAPSGGMFYNLRNPQK